MSLCGVFKMLYKPTSIVLDVAKEAVRDLFNVIIACFISLMVYSEMAKQCI